MRFCKGCGHYVRDEDVDYIYGKDNWLKEIICSICASTIEKVKPKKTHTKKLKGIL